MILSNVNIGSGPSAGDGDPLRTAFNTINQNFARIESNVNSLTNSVSSVAGRTGNITLTVNDIVGFSPSLYPSTSTINGMINTAISNLVDGAPGALDTLNELAAALNDDASFAATIASSLSTLTSNAGAQAQSINTIQSNVTALQANALAQQGLIANLQSTNYGNANVSAYLPGYTGNVGVGNLVFNDLSVQTTAYTGAQWRSNLTSTLTSRPVWLSYVPGGKNQEGTQYGFDTSGMFFGGNADADFAYPVQTNIRFHENETLEVVATIRFNQANNDHGLAIFNVDTRPIWRAGADASRIAFQFDAGIPVLYGQTTANTAPGVPVLSAGNWYTIKFVYSPGTVTVSTFAGNVATGSALDVRTINETLPAGDYSVGFDADMDQVGIKSYFTNLIVRTFSDTVVNNLEVKGTATVGNIIPDGDNIRDLGSPTRQWRHVYTAGGSIYLDNIKLTNNNGKFSAVKVINPGEEDEQEDPEDSDATSEIKSVNKLINGDHELVLTENGTLELDGELFTGGGGGPGLGTYSFDGSILQSDEALIRTNDGDLTLESDSDVFVKSSAGENTWRFDTNGDLILPTGGDIKDNNGDSVLGGGGGEPTISNTVKGFINLVGDRPNNEDNVWFESVVVHGQYAYALGGDDGYIDNSNNRSKVYKFDLETGAQVWVKQIAAGRGATFDLTISAGNSIVTVDAVSAGGVGYKVGEEILIPGWQFGGSDPDNDVILIVDTIGGNNSVLTANVKPGYDTQGLSGTFTGISSPYDDARGDTVAISYDEFNNKLIVVTEYNSGRGDVNDGSWNWVNVYVIDPTTGAIEETVTMTEEGDIYPNSIATYNADGKIAIVGEKYNEYREFGNLTMLNKANGYFDILKSNLDPEHYPGAPYNNYSDFWITGTGIANQENVDQVNEYVNVTTTVRQGSGAVFDLVNNGNGTYGFSTIATAGTNYRVGHKIKILGTSLGGATPDNDAIITVDEIDGSGGIVSATLTGTAPGVVGATFNGVTGSNYNTGSGYTAYIYINPTTGAFSYGGSNNGGTNYVAGDVITVAGTTFAGGTSPANDATLVVNSVDGGGIQSIVNGEVTGTGPTTALRIRVDNVDFTVEGTWAMRQNLGGEAFVWTPSWSNAIGGPSGDRFYDVTWNEDGTALYAVGRGVYEVPYQQALVVKFDAVDGSIIWSKDIKFDEADGLQYDPYRQARAVCMVPDSSDIMVGGEWYNPIANRSELILTRMTSAGAAVWQKTYGLESQGGEQYMDPEISLKASGNRVVMSFEQSTYGNGRGLAYMVINPANGTVDRHRVFSADGNSNYNYYNTPTANFADVYSDATGDYVVMAGYTYVPTDNYYNALLMKLPLDGLVDIAVDERRSIGEHIMNRHTVNITTMTPGFDSFTADEHLDTITNILDARNYVTRAPDGNLNVWSYTITDDSAGYLEFGDGSKQSFATDKIPQIPAANDYYLTEQDSGKHIFFEHENGWVYIPHWEDKSLPVGFTFTVVNTTGSDCYVETMTGDTNRARLKLAGRNIDTYTIGIPDSGSGSMVTFLKIKQGYYMPNSAGDIDYPDVWIVSGPGDIYDND